MASQRRGTSRNSQQDIRMAELTKDPIEEDGNTKERRTYITPVLVDYGMIAELTEGAYGYGVDADIYS
jgi:hypothetical protein